MAKQPQVWRGTKDLTQGKVHYAEESTKTVITTDFSGPYELCLAKKPRIGAALAGLPAAFKITACKVTEGDADTGKIELTLEAIVSDSSYSTAALGEAVYEIEWAEAQLAIERHPRCGKLYSGRAKYKDGVLSPAEGKQRTWEDWQSLIDKNAQDNTGDYEESAHAEKWTVEQYRNRKELGEESYIVGIPIVRRTTIHLKKPTGLGSATGKRQEPPGVAGAPAGYEWLGGPDRCTKTGRVYTRQTEWNGATDVDEFLYPSV